MRCSNLVKVPRISNNSISMEETFGECHNLVNAPAISNKVENMVYTFLYCYNIVNAPDMSNAINVTNMYETFIDCRNLVNFPILNNSLKIDNMYKTFSGCNNLTGDLYIHAENITNATNCFYGTSLNKDVYIPFTYQNGVNTATYNSFINAGYSTTDRVHGALLIDINDEGIDLSDYEYTNISNDITLYNYIGSNSIITTPHLS